VFLYEGGTANSLDEMPLHEHMQQGSMGNKQEELEATMLLESYDLIAITET